MRGFVDTNTVISGLFWHGAPRGVLDLARLGQIQLYTCRGLLAELEDVLQRPKFAERWQETISLEDARKKLL